MTFNVWLVKKLGISISSILEEERLPLIAKHIKDANPDVVAIQEIWSFSLRDKLINKLSAKYPHTYFRKFHVGMGDGMILLSKYPIVKNSSTFHVFEDGTALEEQHLIPLIGVEKGVYKVTLNVDETMIDIFSFHLGAVYFEEEINDYNPEHVAGRAQQIDEMISFIETNIDKTRPTILLGDLNNHFFNWNPGTNFRERKLTYEYETILNANFEDSYMQANNINLEIDSMQVLDIATFDTVNNTYASGGNFGKIPKEFVDYIFYYKNNTIFPARSHVIFKENLPQETINSPKYLSDHYAVLTEFEIHDK